MRYLMERYLRSKQGPPPDTGNYCKCKQKDAGLQSKISRIFGSEEMVCVKCGLLIKPESASEKDKG